MLTESGLAHGNKYIICNNNVQTGVYTYIGIKSALNDQEKMSTFLMFMKCDGLSKCESVEGYEVIDGVVVESSITIQNYQ